MKNFIVDLEYLVPMDQVEPHIKGHMDFVAKGYDKGFFIASGAKVPRTGGVILAKADEREALAGYCNTDPFVISGIAKMTITEFIARRTIDEASDVFAPPEG